MESGGEIERYSSVFVACASLIKFKNTNKSSHSMVILEFAMFN